jgi:DNA-directed RNA polymerase specialized sigma24 family protein
MWPLKCSLLFGAATVIDNIRHSTNPELEGWPSAGGAKSAEDLKKDATDLYWLAFLLTGRRDVSIDIAADAAASEDYPNSFFADWMSDWRRRLVIGHALTAIRDELADSARRTKRAHVDAAQTSERNWSTGPAVTKADLERALLAIDIFPRAVLLLVVFEGMQIADVATLLEADPALVKKAQMIGVHELTASLAPNLPLAFSLRD